MKLGSRGWWSAIFLVSLLCWYWGPGPSVVPGFGLSELAAWGLVIDAAILTVFFLVKRLRAKKRDAE